MKPVSLTSCIRRYALFLCIVYCFWSILDGVHCFCYQEYFYYTSLQICVNQVIVFSINQLLHSLNENNRIREICALYLPNFDIGDLGSTQKGKIWKQRLLLSINHMNFWIVTNIFFWFFRQFFLGSRFSKYVDSLDYWTSS